MHPPGRTLAAWAVMLVWTDIDERGGVPVIGGLEHDHVALSGIRPRQAQGQLVSFAG